MSSGLLTQVNKNKATGTVAMDKSRYHRDQAELCLQMARSMSDRQAADVLCTAAARHFAQAIELEKQARAISATGDKS